MGTRCSISSTNCLRFSGNLQYSKIFLNTLICVFVNKNLIFKQRNDFSISEEENESLYVEIINKDKKNIIINTIYRPPNSKIK